MSAFPSCRLRMPNQARNFVTFASIPTLPLSNARGTAPKRLHRGTHRPASAEPLSNQCWRHVTALASNPSVAARATHCPGSTGTLTVRTEFSTGGERAGDAPPTRAIGLNVRAAWREPFVMSLPPPVSPAGNRCRPGRGVTSVSVARILPDLVDYMSNLSHDADARQRLLAIDIRLLITRFGTRSPGTGITAVPYRQTSKIVARDNMPLHSSHTCRS